MDSGYLSVRDAARLLGVSPQRVTQLIRQGDLEAQRLGRAWIVERQSVERRAREVSSRGGRPRRGHGRNERRFWLMNRTHEVAEVVYNLERRQFVHVGEILDWDRVPMGVFERTTHSRFAASFDAWWRGRGIPGTRAGLARILDDAGVEVPEELLMQNLGLSLSDQFWVYPESSGLAWADINFFNNAFEEAAEAVAGHTSARATTGAHPDNTSDGNLPKHWVATEEGPMLIKEGGRLDQEPYNELVATRLHQRLLRTHEYVPYHLVDSGAEAACACPCFLSDEEEYIPALYVDRILPSRADHGAHRHYVDCCSSLGIADVERSLAKMIVCDDLMANSDRHYRNFGIVRNVETLECRMAPIFDSGTSLWCEVSLADLRRGEFSFQSRQFEQNPARQLLLVDDMGWFEASDLDGFVDEAMAVLQGNPLLRERLPYLERSLRRRVERIVDIREWN